MLEFIPSKSTRKELKIMNKYDAYSILKDMSFEDVILMIIKNNHLETGINESYDTYYTAKDLIKLYPNIFSKYKLDKYIKYENLPFIKDGKERFFLKSSIEKWLEEKNNKAMFNGVF